MKKIFNFQIKRMNPDLLKVKPLRFKKKTPFQITRREFAKFLLGFVPVKRLFGYSIVTA